MLSCARSDIPRLASAGLLRGPARMESLYGFDRVNVALGALASHHRIGRAVVQFRLVSAGLAPVLDKDGKKGCPSFWTRERAKAAFGNATAFRHTTSSPDRQTR